MPSIAALSKIDLPHIVEQQIVKEGARNLFAPSYPQVSMGPGFSSEMVLLQMKKN